MLPMGHARSNGRVLGIAMLLLLAVAVVSWFALRHRGSTRSSAALGSASSNADASPPRARRVPGSGLRPSRPIRLSGADAVRDEDSSSGAISGHVLSEVGSTPVPGARLSFAGPSGLQTVTADGEGKFGFEAPKPGTYALAMATADGYLPFAPDWGDSPFRFEARAGEILSGVSLYLTPAIDYEGKIVDSKGEPVAGARVRVVGADVSELTLAPAPEEWESGPDGTFHFHAQDGAVLEATHARFAPGRGLVDFSVQVGKHLTIRLGDVADAAAPGEALAGVVLSPDGAPVPDAVVTARMHASNPAGIDARLLGTESTTTDEAGRFAFTLTPGVYSVAATAAEWATARQRGVRTPARELILRMAGSSAIEGTVTDGKTGAPVAAFTVYVAERLGPLQLDNVSVASAYDAQGHYRVAGLREGAYVVEVAAYGYAPSGERRVEVGASTEEAAVADFGLLPGGRVTGVVVDAKTSKSIEGARVSLEGGVRSGPSTAQPVAGTVTDGEGRFTLPGLGSGLQSILVAASGHHGRLISGIEGGPGRDVGPITVELNPTDGDEQPRIELAGIGAVLSARGDALVIGRVIEGGGAAEAGLVPGDAILAVDDRSVVELGFQGSIERIRGPEGSVVRLLVRKAGQEEPSTLTVPRRRIRS